MEWSEDIIARLRVLWAEGHSTAEIGRRLGISKNAVVGKAHRLNLPPRPSPIRRAKLGEIRPRVAVRRVSGCTLPPLPAPSAAGTGASAVAATAQRPAMAALPQSALPQSALAQSALAQADLSRVNMPVAAAKTAEAPVVVQDAPDPVPARLPLRPVPQARTRRFSACCWPIGEPGTPSFRFCDDEALAGKPYCTAHAQLAYVKLRDRREDAA